MKKVMADPRMPKDMSAMPFDGKRLIYGGFAPSSRSEARADRLAGRRPDPANPPRRKTMPDDIQIDARTMRGVIPYIGMDGRAGEAADFYVRAFAARDLGRMPGRGRPEPAHALPGRGQRRRADDDRHARAGRAGPEPQGFHLQLVVADGDLWWNRAVAAGCTVVVPFEKMFWGDRWGMLADPFGLTWAINEPAEWQADGAPADRVGGAARAFAAPIGPCATAPVNRP